MVWPTLGSRTAKEQEQEHVGFRAHVEIASRIAIVIVSY